MAKYQKYAEYKNSGVEWLGEIPNHWESKKLKYLLEDLVRGPFGSALKKDFFVHYGFKVYEQKNCIRNDVKIGDSYVPKKIYEELERFSVKPYDLLMSCSGTIGKVVQVPDQFEIGIINQALLIMRLDYKFLSSKFFLYSFRSDDIQNQIKDNTQGGAMQNLVATDIFKSISFAIPPIFEQTQIANFLDYETAQIDTIIAKQEKLIELLKEKRQAVISHAVTKGLNPNVPMKDSGVEWLGEVPEHWEIIKFDYVIETIGDIDHYMPSSVDVGVPYVMTGDLRDFVSDIDFENCKNVSYSDYKKLSKKIKTAKDDIIFARYATIGTLSYVDIDAEFLVSYSCVTIKPNPQRVTGKYLFYYLKSQAFLQAIQQQINSNTQGNVGVDSLRNVRILLPSVFEQERIIDVLKNDLIKMDNLIAKSRLAIQLMQERRTALISAAVTGKIDVRKWQKPNKNNVADRELSA